MAASFTNIFGDFGENQFQKVHDKFHICGCPQNCHKICSWSNLFYFLLDRKPTIDCGQIKIMFGENCLKISADNSGNKQIFPRQIRTSKLKT